MKCGSQKVEISEGKSSCGEALQVVAKSRTRGGPAKTHFVELVSTQACKVQASSNRHSWKPSVMLDPADAFFGDRDEQLPIADNACGRIMHLVVVESERNHSGLQFVSRLSLQTGAFTSNLRADRWRRPLLTFDVTGYRERQKFVSQIFVEIQTRYALPPSIVTASGQDKSRKQPCATKKMLCKGSVAMNHTHYFKLRAYRLPWKSAVDHQPKKVCFRLYKLDDRLRDLSAYPQFLHLFVERSRQRRKHPLFPTDAILASVAKLKQVPIVQTIEAVRFPQYDHVGKQSGKREEVFVRLKCQGFRNRADLAKDFLPVSHPAGT